MFSVFLLLRHYAYSPYTYFTWGLSLEADLRLRPALHTHNRDREKSSGQATQFNIWTIWAMDRTSVQPQVILIFLCSNSVIFQPLDPAHRCNDDHCLVLYFFQPLTSSLHGVGFSKKRHGTLEYWSGSHRIVWFKWWRMVEYKFYTIKAGRDDRSSHFAVEQPRMSRRYKMPF